MKLPTPDDMAFAPVWENYIIAQLVQASLGQIPEHALGVGVSVEGSTVGLRFQMSEVTDRDEEDIEDIISEFEALVGNDVTVDAVHWIATQVEVSPFDGVCWTFLARP